MARPTTKKKAAPAKAAAKKVKVKISLPAPKMKAPKTLNVGSAAPDFKMPATKIGEVSRANLKGKPYVLYFYPKDDTSGCTAEACGFRDALPAFGKLKLTVIGVSRDSLQSHEKFTKKYDLTFPLASDENGAVCASFGVWVEKSMYGRKYMGIERSTFLIDDKGIIRAIWRKVKVPGHIDEVKDAARDI
jgi:thioredoxin-dependent peroxiredoxin